MLPSYKRGVFSERMELHCTLQRLNRVLGAEQFEEIDEQQLLEQALKITSDDDIVYFRRVEERPYWGYVALDVGDPFHTREGLCAHVVRRFRSRWGGPLVSIDTERHGEELSTPEGIRSTADALMKLTLLPYQHVSVFKDGGGFTLHAHLYKHDDHSFTAVIFSWTNSERINIWLRKVWRAVDPASTKIFFGLMTICESAVLRVDNNKLRAVKDILVEGGVFQFERTQFPLILRFLNDFYGGFRFVSSDSHLHVYARLGMECEQIKLDREDPSDLGEYAQYYNYDMYMIQNNDTRFNGSDSELQYNEHFGEITLSFQPVYLRTAGNISIRICLYEYFDGETTVSPHQISIVTPQPSGPAEHRPAKLVRGASNGPSSTTPRDGPADDDV